MEMVEVVIKLPKEDYAQYKSIAEWMISNNFNTNNTLTKLQICIANGTVLPKGHGRLIDADEYEFDVLTIREPDLDRILEYLADAETIIEADKEAKE